MEYDPQKMTYEQYLKQQDHNSASYEQYSNLIDFIEKNSVMVKPHPGTEPNAHCEQLWKQLALRLNSVGIGVTRTTQEWKQEWKDWSFNTILKASKLKQGVRVGNQNGQNLTALEKRVLCLLGFPKAAGVVESEKRVIRVYSVTPTNPPASSTSTLPTPAKLPTPTTLPTPAKFATPRVLLTPAKLPIPPILSTPVKIPTPPILPTPAKLPIPPILPTSPALPTPSSLSTPPFIDRFAQAGIKSETHVEPNGAEVVNESCLMEEYEDEEQSTAPGRHVRKRQRDSRSATIAAQVRRYTQRLVEVKGKQKHEPGSKRRGLLIELVSSASPPVPPTPSTPPGSSPHSVDMSEATMNEESQDATDDLKEEPASETEMDQVDSLQEEEMEAEDPLSTSTNHHRSRRRRAVYQKVPRAGIDQVQYYRLRLAEMREKLRHEREAERRRLNHELEMERLRIESRRLEVQKSDNEFLIKLTALAQAATDLLSRSRTS